MSKRVFIIHGWGGNPDEPMLKWVRESLQVKGCEVLAPLMPHPDVPTIDDWVNFLKETIKDLDENTILIGHSVGCQTIIRYLESLPENEKAGQVVLIAPWMILSLENLGEDEDPEIAKPWMETPIDFDKVKLHSDNFTGIFSTDDPFVPLSVNENLLKEKLGAKTIVLENKGHFTEEDGVTELPEVLTEILNL